MARTSWSDPTRRAFSTPSAGSCPGSGNPADRRNSGTATPPSALFALFATSADVNSADFFKPSFILNNLTAVNRVLLQGRPKFPAASGGQKLRGRVTWAGSFEKAAGSLISISRRLGGAPVYASREGPQVAGRRENFSTGSK